MPPGDGLSLGDTVLGGAEELAARLKRDGGVGGKDAAVWLAKGALDFGGRWYAVYVGWQLLTAFGQHTSAAVWFGFMAIRVGLELMVATKEGAASVAATLLQARGLRSWWILRGPVAQEDARDVALEASNVITAFFSWFQDLPHLFVSAYQTVDIIFGASGDATAEGGRTVNQRALALFAVNVLYSSYSTVASMHRVELMVMYKGEKDGATDDEKRAERGRQRAMLDTMGLLEPKQRALTYAWRMASTTSRLLGYSAFVVADSALQGRGASAGIVLVGFISWAFLVALLFYDGDERGQEFFELRQLEPPRPGRLCGGGSCGGADTARYLAFWNLVAPCEQIGAFFPLANSPFRFALVLTFEFASALGVWFGYTYAKSNDALHGVVLNLFRVIAVFFALNGALFLAWMVRQRRTAWPLRACFRRDPAASSVAPLLAPEAE